MRRWHKTPQQHGPSSRQCFPSHPVLPVLLETRQSFPVLIYSKEGLMNLYQAQHDFSSLWHLSRPSLVEGPVLLSLAHAPRDVQVLLKCFRSTVFIKLSSFSIFNASWPQPLPFSSQALSGLITIPTHN